MLSFGCSSSSSLSNSTVNTASYSRFILSPEIAIKSRQKQTGFSSASAIRVVIRNLRSCHAKPFLPLTLSNDPPVKVQKPRPTDLPGGKLGLSVGRLLNVNCGSKRYKFMGSFCSSIEVHFSRRNSSSMTDLLVMFPDGLIALVLRRVDYEYAQVQIHREIEEFQEQIMFRNYLPLL